MVKLNCISFTTSHFEHISAEGTITDNDGIECTVSHECKTQCREDITITFNTPQYLAAFRAEMFGLEQETSYGTHLCYFRPTVVFQGDEEIYSGTKILFDTTETVVNRPADTIKLESRCGSGVQCVTKVIETDVNNWTGLKLGGSLYSYYA